MNKIKKCPFCGKDGKMNEHDYMGIRYYVCCSNPDCECTLVFSYKTKEEAIKIWNARVKTNE